MTSRLDELADAANRALRAKNMAAVAQLEAERALGQYIAETAADTNPDTKARLRVLGIDRHRITAARKLAAVPDEQLSLFCSNTMAAGKEITNQGALKLLPRAAKPEATGPAAYAAPPIDTEIARRYGLDLGEHLAELLANSIENGLARLTNDNQRAVWMQYIGVNQDGSYTSPMSFDAIGTRYGWSRPTAAALYYRASHYVRGQIASDAYAQIRTLLS